MDKNIMLNKDMEIVKSLIVKRSEFKHFYPWMMDISSELKKTNKLSEDEIKNILWENNYKIKGGATYWHYYIRLIINKVLNLDL